ncbi:hypothetical protein QAD02_020236 [Eretmocerus hayati]|uniref:Uncharacterized protein n=1 Tax=Eretmocerus hayati TaxID=131215 RepID=A0ACC2PLH9_9HYME|nr:hypothetical protein QAD02_020236 [Eretmocerus hayati]
MESSEIEAWTARFIWKVLIDTEYTPFIQQIISKLSNRVQLMRISSTTDKFFYTVNMGYTYADYARIYGHCPVTDLLEFVLELNEDAMRAHVWARISMIPVNPSKTKFMVLGSVPTTSVV